MTLADNQLKILRLISSYEDGYPGTCGVEFDDAFRGTRERCIRTLGHGAPLPQPYPITFFHLLTRAPCALIVGPMTNTFSADLLEMMTAWDKIRAAAIAEFPHATEDELQAICSSAMEHALKPRSK